jgi:hypothetical protein
MEYWKEQIIQRLEAFRNDSEPNGFAISIKIKTASGCFCKNCCPYAWQLIDEFSDHHREDSNNLKLVKHESGPELLLYLGIAVACLGITEKGLGIIKSACDLITLILKARVEGQKNGDKRQEPFSIIVRGVGADGNYFEKQLFQVDSDTMPKEASFEKALDEVIRQIAEERVRLEQNAEKSSSRSS